VNVFWAVSFSLGSFILFENSVTHSISCLGGVGGPFGILLFSTMVNWLGRILRVLFPPKVILAPCVLGVPLFLSEVFLVPYILGVPLFSSKVFSLANERKADSAPLLVASLLGAQALVKYGSNLISDFDHEDSCFGE
jgi:apolipoprotein N-acyltransferase